MADRQSTRPKSATLAPVSGSRAAGAVAAAWTWAAHTVGSCPAPLLRPTPLLRTPALRPSFWAS